MSLLWFFLALGAAITNSWVQTVQKFAVNFSRYSKFTISFIAATLTSLMLFAVSYFVFGMPDIKEGFWTAVSITGILNAVTLPVMLKAYEIGEFSSVYSMILMSPVFLLLTSFLFLGEVPTALGVLGVALTASGLMVISRSKGIGEKSANFKNGNILGLFVAAIWSVSVNFDKLSAKYSNVFFAPAVTFAYIALISAVYLLWKYKSLFIEIPDGKILKESGLLNIRRVSIILLLGFLMVISQYFHNAALLAGPASYTIAVKRTGILWGVIWGWMFFRENNISRKFLGALTAVAGVLAILFA